MFPSACRPRPGRQFLGSSGDTDGRINSPIPGTKAFPEEHPRRLRTAFTLYVGRVSGTVESLASKPRTGESTIFVQPGASRLALDFGSFSQMRLSNTLWACSNGPGAAWARLQRAAIREVL